MSEVLEEPGAAAPEPADDQLAGGAGAGAAGVEPEGQPSDQPVEQQPAAEEPGLDPMELQAELEYMRNELGQYQQMFQALQQQPAQQGQAQPGFDPSQLVDEYGNLDAAAFGNFLQQRDEALLQGISQVMQPLSDQFTAQQEEAQIATGEENLDGMLEDDIARHGEFASKPEADAAARRMVRTLADQMFPEIAGRYGATPRAAEMAMTRAAAEVRDLLQSVGGAAVTAETNRLATLAGAAGEPGPGGAGGVVSPGIRVGEKSVDRFFGGGGQAAV